MIRTAFSTVACPTWTLEHVADAAARWGYMGVEFRSFGQGGTQIACDPALTDGVKVRAVLTDAGVDSACIASGVRFDTPVFPPVLGEILLSREATIREARHMISVARDCGTPYVRVFAFESPGRERRPATMKRITNRLRAACDFARNREVTLLLENGGSFPTARDLAEILDAVNSPMLAACYDGATAWQAGEDVELGAALLGPRLRVVRLRDLRDGRPARLGTGQAPCRAMVRAAADVDAAWRTDPWVVYTWDRLWLPELSPAEDVLPAAPGLIAQWGGQTIGRLGKLEARQSAAPAMSGV